ncbi:MAG: hypothetical protein P9M07_02130 [Candidatus Aceula meridiana]|nr:hypothetical protein [Candidatus Aceula meridiana]
MNKNRHKKKAFSTLEYTACIVFIIASLMIMRKPIARIFMGRWKTLGDSFMHGQQLDYDPNVTRECGQYVPIVDPEELPLVWGDPVWYNYRCYECCMDRIGPTTCPAGLATAADLLGCRAEADPLLRRACCADACKDEDCN